MAADILERSLADRRRSTIWWTIGVAAYTFVNVAVYPSVKDQASLNDLVKDYPPAVMALFGIDVDKLDITSAVGYLGSQMNLIGPLLLVMVGVAYGAATIAGEEERGTLALVLSYPVARSRVVLEKAVAVAFAVVAVGVGLFLTILAGRVFQLDIPLDQLAAFCAALILIGILFGYLALAVGAATGSKALATGVTAVVAGATYLISSLAPVVSGVRPLRWISPFWYAMGGNPLANGLSWRDGGVLVAVALVFLTLAVVLFSRRDVRG